MGNKIQKNKALKMFLVVTLSFAICFTPLLLTITVESYTGAHVPDWINFIISWLAFSNSGLNVFIYFLFNHSYRQTAKKLISKRFSCCKGSVVPVNT